uniref:glycosyltransferase n=1 Tax=Flavobacterium sp. TaxID=239 RepID=UPI00404A70C0
MRVLLIGEYSRLHNSLKTGLEFLGHTVVLISDGDGFKNYETDLSIRSRFFDALIPRKFKNAIYKIFKIDLSELERGYRFYCVLKKLDSFDVVQLINERPIKTWGWLERFLLKKTFEKFPKVFLLSCGIDYLYCQFLLAGGFKRSLLDPYFANKKLYPDFKYILQYQTKNHQKTHELVFKNIKGVIASDVDYLLPLKNNPHFLGLIPNPIQLQTLEFEPFRNQNTIHIFLGINRGTYHKKGIVFFEKAIEIIAKKYDKKVRIEIVENLPYQEYIKKFNEAHIVLDQIYAYDQGYNALEAMAKGKVVFTGAEQEFLDIYKLSEDEVCINALPDLDYLVEKISHLIENPGKIAMIGTAARAFIEKEHDAQKIASTYISKWA